MVDQLHAGVSLELVQYCVRNERERERNDREREKRERERERERNERESSVKHKVIIVYKH